MKLLCWNVRGLGKPRARRRLHATLRDAKPSIIFLMETKLQSNEMATARRRCGFLSGIDVSSRGRNWGLFLARKDGCDVTLRSFSTHHIDIMVSRDTEGHCWRFTGFYGAPEEHLRKNSWNLLRSLDNCPNVPWVVIGDFNEILLSTEKMGGR
ncbi:hypothetical protein HRI_000839800 [Hibiscus trionum]|uniref:Endonuclease/exonuclease/phosphatase domain-containing protein n=1 Tax=Hibiscus trionum TaxID=183268 RepID=A0A9W7LQH6_HIBTR|nr:hypothetical protein HRI_000839800 [Hibiscus trionum]